jgi:uncharacterized membrane protein
MDLFGLVHTACAVAALLLGPAVFLRRKGDRWHRRLGYAYVASMAALNGTAFALYDLFGGWGPFHWAAVASFATLLMGFVPAYRRRPANWLAWHYVGMCWSYVGLAAAAAAEFFTRVPQLWPATAAVLPRHYFWIATAVSTFVVGGVGTYLIRIRKLGFPAGAG